MMRVPAFSSPSLLFVAALVASPWVARAAPVDFVREIQPILAEHCTHCHGMDEGSRKGGLRLDQRDAALRGGKSGEAALVPGKPDAGTFLARILSHDPDEVMPPPREKKPVSSGQVEVLRRWIAEGAPYAEHWAFVAPQKTTAAQGRNPIDALVQQKLAGMQWESSPPATPAELCRRIHLDLIGLPPSPAELDAYEVAAKADAPGAARALVEKLLQSPQYSEKWARHWLDVARYSDSNGYEKDLPRDQWAWRDWVIQSIQRDLPYNQFLIEQIAGDLLPQATQDQIVATGFLRNSMVNEEGAIVPEQFRMDEMFDRMDCIGKAALGLSLQCAQCHSHKFDPISHQEYFGLFAFLNNSHEAQSWVHTPDQRKKIGEIQEGVRKAEDKLKTQRPQWQAELAAWEQRVAAAQVEWHPLKASDLGSVSGLNHPTQEPDLSILCQGHPTTSADVYGIFEGDFQGVTGLRLEALTHGDLPFNGPGRSKYGTWAVSELTVTFQRPGSDQWEPLKLVNATADFSEPDGRMEPDWKASFDPEDKRVRGPVAYLIDGNADTAWRSDRGPGLRNQESVAVAQFEKPPELPSGTKLKIAMTTKHGGDDNGRHNTMLGRYRYSLTRAPQPKAPPVNHAAVLALATPAEKRAPGQRDAVFTAWRLSVPEAKAVNDEIAALWKGTPAARTSVLHLAERRGADVRVTNLLDRGAWDQPKDAIPPHVPAALHPLDADGPPDRLAFARWIADSRSPLTARVAVNRAWQVLFGAGLVETSEDFGTRAPVPEHLAVLDWLAVDFMEHGWSQKHLLRTILTSATYQQSSHAGPVERERDPANRYLARGPRFRLEAEVIRDSALSVAGLLYHQVGGPSIFPPVPQSVLDYNYVKPTYWIPLEGPERYRRALYLFRKRSMPDPVLGSFDAPTGDLSCARRPRSNTPLSALASLNETTFVEAAQAMAQRILREGGTDDAARAAYAFRLCTSRSIRPAEFDAIRKLLEENRARLRKGELKAGEIAFSPLTDAGRIPVDATPNEIAAWTIVCRVLLNLDETLTKG